MRLLLAAGAVLLVSCAVSGLPGAELERVCESVEEAVLAQDQALSTLAESDWGEASAKVDVVVREAEAVQDDSVVVLAGRWKAALDDARGADDRQEAFRLLTEDAHQHWLGISLVCDIAGFEMHETGLPSADSDAVVPVPPAPEDMPAEDDASGLPAWTGVLAWIALLLAAIGAVIVRRLRLLRCVLIGFTVGSGLAISGYLVWVVVVLAPMLGELFGLQPSVVGVVSGALADAETSVFGVVYGGVPGALIGVVVRAARNARARAKAAP